MIMKRILIPLMIGFSSVTYAQPTQMQFDSLEARIAYLERTIDVAFFKAVQIPCVKMDSARPYELANGDYPIGFHMRQIACGVDDFGRAIVDLLDRMPPNGRTVQEYVNSAVASVSGGGVLSNIVNGDLIVRGRVCAFYGNIGSFPRDSCQPIGAMFQAFGEGADVFLASNLAGLNSQSPRPHGARIGLAPDGGIRIGNNEPFNNPFYDDQRPWAYTGYDSQSTWSMYQNAPGHESAQDIIWVFDEALKTVWIQSMRPGWKIKYKNSTCTNCADIIPPEQENLVDISARSYTLVNDQGPVVTMGLSTNNEKPYPGRLGRLTFNWYGSYASEIMTEPGPQVNCRGNICAQFMQMGPIPLLGQSRSRLTTTLAMDNAGGLSGVIDATTTDASGTLGQKKSPPLCLNAGENVGMFLCLYPSDNTIDLQDKLDVVSTGRTKLSSLITRF
jgi:hypothetical protein